MSVESPAFANQAKTYPAEQTRRAVLAQFARTGANSPGILAGGIFSPADCQLSAPASGLSVNVGAGEAIIPGTEGGTQGGYYGRVASQTNLAISAANPTNPRIDTVCATVSDSGYTEPSGGSGDQWALQVVTGTPTSGATLANLLGAAALPGSSLLLGYVLVPANATNIVAGDIANAASVAATWMLSSVGTQSVARAYRSAVFTSSGTGWTKVLLDTKSFDPNGNFDVTTNHRYNVPSAGYYQVNAALDFGYNNNPQIGRVGIYHNGSVAAHSGFEFRNLTTADIINPSVSDIISCAAGDYLELWVDDEGTNTIQLNAGSPQNYLSVVRIA